MARTSNPSVGRRRSSCASVTAVLSALERVWATDSLVPPEISVAERLDELEPEVGCDMLES